ncbi:Vacuolar protein sorting-associated protein ist1 [Coemansia sp. Benny D115]|nr:Vacuolar protein sorting-associated protein ist1 [Coemansia sp. Benny D115]
MPFSLSKFKVELKLAVNRLRLLQAKKSSLNAKARREIATLLESGKERSAYIRVENIIREDFNVEALEMVELYCELLTARAGLIEQSRTADPGISEAIWSIVYASTRAEVRELTLLREMLTLKYGAESVKSAMDNAEGQVDPKLVRKLSPNAPSQELVKLYLKEISAVYRVNWRPADEKSDDEGGGSPSGGVKERAAGASVLSPPPALPSDLAELELLEEDAEAQEEGAGDVDELLPSVPEEPSKAGGEEDAVPAKAPSPKPVAAAKAPAKVATPLAAAKPKKATPGPASAALGSAKPKVQTQNDGLPTLDELQRRFEALKRR